jgi:hypothetical protein
MGQTGEGEIAASDEAGHGVVGVPPVDQVEPRGRVSMPNRHGLSALILKGEGCGSESSVTVAERTDGASGTDQDDVAGQKAGLGTREFVNLLTGVS